MIQCTDPTWKITKHSVNLMETEHLLIPVALRSKAWVCAASLLGLWVRIPPGHRCLSLVIVVCCQVEVSEPGRSLVQRSPTEYVCV